MSSSLFVSGEFDPRLSRHKEVKRVYYGEYDSNHTDWKGDKIPDGRDTDRVEVHTWADRQDV